MQYLEKVWPDDPWAHGGYAANPAPGVWTEHGATGWRTACGPVHWAGTETSSVWNGYIDGAINSGHRAAAEGVDPDLAEALWRVMMEHFIAQEARALGETDDR